MPGQIISMFFGHSKENVHQAAADPAPGNVFPFAAGNNVGKAAGKPGCFSDGSLKIGRNIPIVCEFRL